MNFRKLKKTFTFFILTMSLFWSSGLSSCAYCFNMPDNSCHKMTNITCSCCHQKIKNDDGSSYDKLNQNVDNCNCIKAPFRSNANIQSASKLNLSLLDIETIYSAINPFLNPIIYKDISYKQTCRSPILSFNKNLEMLKTVILLN